MPPRKEEDFKNIRDNRKAEILDAAIALFAEKGFYGASMSQLAKNAGISKGLAYNYFSNKEQLMKEVVLHGLKQMFGGITFTEGVFTDDDMDKLLIQNFDLLDESPHYWKLYFSVILQPEVMNLVIESILQMLKPMLDAFSEYFKRKGYKDYYQEAFFFGALLDGISLNYLYNNEDFPREYAIKRIKEIINLKTNQQ